jgi:hypothetical protein
MFAPRTIGNGPELPNPSAQSRNAQGLPLNGGPGPAIEPVIPEPHSP